MPFAHLDHSRIRQPHGVDHPAVELRHARRQRPRSRLQAYGLRDDSAQAIEANDVGELLTVGGGAGREKHRILKRDAAELDGETPTPGE
jgi:hypothetical protein